MAPSKSPKARFGVTSPRNRRLPSFSPQRDADVNGHYIRCKTPRERVDRILLYIRRRHGWSLKDLLRVYVTAETDQPSARSLSGRADFLADAIYGQEEVVGALRNTFAYAENQDIGHLTRRLRGELSALEEEDGRPGVLGKFDPTTSINQLRLPQLIDQIMETVPQLWELLSCLVAPKRASNRDDTFVNTRLALVTSTIAYTRAPRLCDQLPTLLGIYLHSMGVKRRVLELYNHTGAIVGYNTLQDRRSKLAEEGKVCL
jgi:hypothetical protein